MVSHTVVRQGSQKLIQPSHKQPNEHNWTKTKTTTATTIETTATTMATTTTDNNDDGDRDDDHMQRRSLKRVNSALPATHSSRLARHGLSGPIERNFQRQLATWRCAASLLADGAQHQPKKRPLHREQVSARQSSSSRSAKASWKLRERGQIKTKL